MRRCAVKATLTIEPRAGGPPDEKRIVIGCDHGTTTTYTINSPTERITDAEAVALALAQHRACQPGCKCIRHLEKRYGRRPAA